MTTLQRLMLTSTVVPFTFSGVMRSTWMTHFRRYTCTILPSRPLWVPGHHLYLFVLAHRDRPRVVLVAPSAERGALISTRRTLEGAVKCSFRHFHREPDTRRVVLHRGRRLRRTAEALFAHCLGLSFVVEGADAGSGFKFDLHGYSNMYLFWETNIGNNYDHLEINDSSRIALRGRKFLHSSQLISPACGLSTVDSANGDQILSEVRNLAENSVALTNESRASVTDKVSWQHRTNTYDILWGSCSMGSYTGRACLIC